MSVQSASLLVSSQIDFSFGQNETLDALGGAASRFAHNIAAIKLLKQIETYKRPSGALTTEEQFTLARYSGWGDSEVLNRAFPQGAYSWAKPCDELKGLLTEEETESLRASTLNAHYTRLDVIRAIYAAIEHLGLSAWGKLRVLEPAAGVGHFLGVMPTSLVVGAERAAVELDSITARILERLYPATRVFACGFEAAQLPKDYFDLIIVNARLVAATNRKLEKDLSKGRFREDLYWRLNVIQIRVPPLRERLFDIPLLVEHFLAKAAQSAGKPPLDVSLEALAVLTSYTWPGNVRELENAIECAVAFAPGAVLTPDVLPKRVRSSSVAAELIERSSEENPTLRELEREYILKTLRRTKGNKKRAAALLGLDRKTLYRKLLEYRAEGINMDE